MNSEENPSLPANFYNFQLNTQVKNWGKGEEQYCCSVFHFFRCFFSFSLASPRLMYSKDSQVMSVFQILSFSLASPRLVYSKDSQVMSVFQILSFSLASPRLVNSKDSQVMSVFQILSFSLASPRLVYSKDSQVMSAFQILYLYQYKFKTGLFFTIFGGFQKGRCHLITICEA